MEKKRSFDSLTGLKGIFIFIIVFFHTLPSTPLIDRIPLTSFVGTYGGTLGNYMFFTLSGFLISFGYRERICDGKVSFGDFICRRLYKLYPLYLLSNAAMLVADLIQYGLSAINLKNIILTLLLQNGGGLETTHPYNGPTWFVSALFVCYMAYYLIGYLSKNRTQYLCLIAFGIIWGYSIAVGGWTPTLNFARNGDSFLTFFTGCAIAELYPCMPRLHDKIIQFFAFLVLIASAVLMLKYGVEIIGGNVSVAFAFVICPLIIYLTLENNLISRILKSKAALWLGRISVSVYFWHFVIYVFFRYFWNLYSNGLPIGNVQYLIYLGLLMVLSCLSHRFLEQPHHS
ncbi:MAG: acyltransferase [Oscillospiraceae bacterium]|nr:acyltransferase [Oscillospiraceae bacterium]